MSTGRGATVALGHDRARDLKERVVGWVLFACAAVSTLVTVGIVAVLLGETLAFFSEVSFLEFVTETRWTPHFQEKHFGIAPLLAGSFLVAGGAALIAIPVGLLTAIFLSEYAPGRLRRTLKPVLEILAGIPTVVYGYFALTFVTPVLRGVLGVDTVQIFNAASAGIVVGIMIVPTVASLSEDALTAVPRTLREGALGLGATKRQTVLKVVFPAALSGIVAAVILAMGRAIGETMIVAIAAGNLPTLTADPFSQIQTMTAYIVQAVQGEAPRGSITYESLFAVGALLFTMTLTLNLAAQAVVRRFRQEY